MIAALLVISAALKLYDPTAAKLVLANDWGVPGGLILPLVWAISLVEVVLAVALFARLAGVRFLATVATVVFLAGVSTSIMLQWWTNSGLPCGCGLRLSSSNQSDRWLSLVRNGAMIGLVCLRPAAWSRV